MMIKTIIIAVVMINTPFQVGDFSTGLTTVEKKETAEATSRGVLFCLLKKVFLKLPQISPENNFIKTTLLKKDSNTGVFL